MNTLNRCRFTDGGEGENEGRDDEEMHSDGSEESDDGNGQEFLVLP